MQPTAGPPDPLPDDHARWRMAVVDALLAAAYAGIFLGYSVVLLRSKLFFLPWITPPELSAGPLQVALHLELVSFTAFALVVVYAGRPRHPPDVPTGILRDHRAWRRSRSSPSASHWRSGTSRCRPPCSRWRRMAAARSHGSRSSPS